jgi:hypothetical protein
MGFGFKKCRLKNKWGGCFSIRLNGVDYRSIQSGADVCAQNLDLYFTNSVYNSASNQIVSWWDIPVIGGTVRVRQILRPTDLDSLKTIEIKYEVVNNSMVPVTIGLTLWIDPMLHTVDNPRVAVGAFFTDTGKIFGVPAIPTAWQAFQISPTFSGSQIIARGTLRYDFPDSFGIGEAWTTPFGRGLKMPCWNIRPEGWINRRYTECASFLQWLPQALMRDDPPLEFLTYYGYGAPMRPGDGWLDWGPITEFRASFSACTLENISPQGRLATYNYAVPGVVHNVRCCLSFNTGSGVSVDGPACITVRDSMTTFLAWPVNFNISIPDGYSSSGTRVDTLYYSYTCAESLYLATIVDTVEFTVPFFNATPPSVTLLDRGINYLNCPTGYEYIALIRDTDSRVDAATIRISINSSYYSYADGLFSFSNDTLRLRIDSLLVTSLFDTIRLNGTVRYCLVRVVDGFGCAADTICDTLVLDYGGPRLTTITPPAGSHCLGARTPISMIIRDSLNTVDSTTIHFSINGTEHFMTSPNLRWERTENRLTYTPSSDYPVEGMLTVCLHSASDRNDACFSNPLQNDTCWNYYTDYTAPRNVRIIRPLASDTAISCRPRLDSLIFVAQDGSGFIKDSVYIRVTGSSGTSTVYRGSDLIVRFGATASDPDTFILFDRMILEEGAMGLEIWGITDSCGNVFSSTIHESYYVDWHAPLYGIPVPPSGSIIGLPPTCSMPLNDDRGSEYFQQTTIRMTLQRDSMMPSNIFYGGSELLWAGGTLAMNFSGHPFLMVIQLQYVCVMLWIYPNTVRERIISIHASVGITILTDQVPLFVL